MKKLTLPGGLPPAAVPCTTALSNRFVPRASVPAPRAWPVASPADHGVVDVDVGTVRTVKHSVVLVEAAAGSEDPL
jgi:hypothetical protein